MAERLKKPSFKKKRVARIKGAIAPREELKYVDTAQADYQTGTAGSITLLNGIAVGDDNTTRDGRQATMRSVHIRGFVASSGALAPNLPGLARVMVVWDNCPNGVLPAVLDIVSAATATSFPLINNQERFTILRDMEIPLDYVNVAATTTLVPRTFPVDLYVKLASVSQFNGTGATIASLQNGALYLLTQGTNAGTGSVYCVLSARVRFSDD